MNKQVLLHGGSMTATAFMQLAPEQKHRILGMLCFSEGPLSLNTGNHSPCAYVPMKNLGIEEATYEIWQGNTPLIEGKSGAIHYQHDDDILFGVISVSESAFEATPDKTPLQQATEVAYREIFTLIETLQYPHLFRFWNYIADINTVSFELERYWQFNMGRYDAFVASQQEVIGSVPAACALGFNGLSQVPLTIAFMAGRVKPIAIENPRQISAYEYPRQYGPISPTFSRAVLINLKHSELLLISGTASIVGHATQHESDVTVQTYETMVNFEAILEEANRFAQQAKFSVLDLHYRVYVRNPENLTQVQAEMTRYLGQSPNAVYLQADICRQDLLLEIEATIESPLASFFRGDVEE
jgi:enamine deaminase RidA (YjgF/YER057c/UK114 family)